MYLREGTEPTCEAPIWLEVYCDEAYCDVAYPWYPGYPKKQNNFMKSLNMIIHQRSKRDPRTNGTTVSWGKFASCLFESGIWRVSISKYGKTECRKKSRTSCLFHVQWYHRFRLYASLENKTPAEAFPKFPSVIRVIDRSDRNPPITATSVTFWLPLRQASGLWLVDFDPICQ